MERKDYQEPVDRESGPAGARRAISYSCTVRRHILRVKYPNGNEKQITIDPIIPDRPDDFDPMKIQALPADPALPKGISRIYCEGQTFCASVSLKGIDPEKKSMAAIKRKRVNRANGSNGGRPLTVEKQELVNAIQGVRARLKNNPSLGMKRACELERREKELPITWEALRKHVKKPRRAV